MPTSQQAPAASPSEAGPPPSRLVSGARSGRGCARTAFRILGIAGSLRRDSRNRELLYAAARALPPGTEMLVFEGLKEVPPFDEDDESDPAPAVVSLRAQIVEADAVLIATPE